MKGRSARDLHNENDLNNTRYRRSIIDPACAHQDDEKYDYPGDDFDDLGHEVEAWFQVARPENDDLGDGEADADERDA